MEPWQLDRTKKEAASVIFAFFETGKNKDLTNLGKFHAPTDLFTKFDENPPYTRQNSEEAFVYEQAGFANISDYSYEVEDLRIDLVNDVAIATFYLSYKGMFVNDYSFEGKTVGSKSRATMVLARFQGAWRIVHAHFSSLPEIPKSQNRT
ncbi:MAG: nuclear transport factor 2 family protein [Thaumarchaeota archaeon]|nr:nuclear transport factor 2 family protein [Nitrososphaerota archaeon]